MTVQALKSVQEFDTREEWLLFVTNGLRPHFKKAGYEIPAAVRFAVGFMVTGYRSKAIGECHSPKSSADKHTEIFIAPSQDDAKMVAKILAHELVHAAVGVEHGHKRPFAKACTALGFEGKPKQSLPGDALMRDLIVPLLSKAGKLPHRKLSTFGPKKKQTTRLLKCECLECGYVARVSAKWVNEIGAPYCGVRSHGRMLCEDEAEEGGEE